MGSLEELSVAVGIDGEETWKKFRRLTKRWLSPLRLAPISGLLMLLVGSSGCCRSSVPGELTRSTVAGLVQQSPEFQTPRLQSVLIGPEDVLTERADWPVAEALLALGYLEKQERKADHRWKSSGDPNRSTRDWVMLTSKGEAAFDDERPWPSFEAARREFAEITGIADAGEGLKEIQFTWRWSLTTLSEELAAKCPQFRSGFGADSPGRALVRRYTTDWRLERLSVDGGALGSIGDLTRTDAARLVEGLPLFTEPDLYWFGVGRINRHAMGNEDPGPYLGPRSRGPLIDALLTCGYMEEVTGQDDRKKIKMTSRGNAATADSRLVDGELAERALRLAESKLVEVTGITELKPNLKEVHFRWRWSLTSLGRELSEVSPIIATRYYGTSKSSTRVRRFDDGWRLVD